MITPDEEKYILGNAYIPEHLVGLMAHLSGGEPFLIDDFFCCVRKNWVVLVGYPLQRNFKIGPFQRIVEEIRDRFRPRYLSLIAPKLPDFLSGISRERESDCYYTLETQLAHTRGSVKRNLIKARQALSIESAHHMGREHQRLVHEFIDRVKPPSAVRELLMKMPDYVETSEHTTVLNAWNTRGTLAAFYIVDLEARDFSSYIIGCFSRKRYVLGASDLLMAETIKLSLHHEKRYIHLGLGVNAGIQRFKEKWGGKPTLEYEKCEISFGKTSIMDTIFSLKNRNG